LAVLNTLLDSITDNVHFPSPVISHSWQKIAYSWGFGRAAECRFSSCSRLACVQAAAAARVAGKDGIYNAAGRGDVAAVQDYLTADASCVNEQNWR
jgi:hypothetical protein